MAKISTINKRFVQIQAQHFLSQMGYFYVASKSNKKKAKHFFMSFPFFFYDHTTQSKMYDAIQNNNIDCNLDQKEALKKLCYQIYVDLSKSLQLYYISYDEFYVHIEDKCYEEEIQYKYFKYNNLHTYLFALFMFSISLLYYIIQTKN